MIRKGKAHKPNEFGRLVRVDEGENGIVSGYQVLEGNAADTGSFLPALDNVRCAGASCRLPLSKDSDLGA